MKRKSDISAIFRTEMPLRAIRPTPALKAYLEHVAAASTNSPEKILAILESLKKQDNCSAYDRGIVPDALQDHRRNSNSSDRVKQWIHYIRAVLAKSSNEIVRLHVSKKDIAVISQALSSMERQGEIAKTQHVNPLAGKKIGAQLTSLVVFPPNWRNPAVPEGTHMYSRGDEQDAHKAMKAATTAGRYARLLRSSEWLADALFHDPGQFETRLGYAMDCRRFDYILEVWEPSTYLRYCSVAYSQNELLDHIGRVYLSFNLEHLIQDTKREIGTKNNMDGSNQRREEQRRLFMKLRETYPVAKVSKEWLIREKICKAHPRKLGWGIRTVKKNLKGLA